MAVMRSHLRGARPKSSFTRTGIETASSARSAQPNPFWPKSSFTRTGIETAPGAVGRFDARGGRRAHSPEQELRPEWCGAKAPAGGAAGPKSSFTRTGIETTSQPPTSRPRGDTGRRAHSPEQELRRCPPATVGRQGRSGRRAHSPEQELRREGHSSRQRTAAVGRRAHSPEQELRPESPARARRRPSLGRRVHSPEQELRPRRRARKALAGPTAEELIHQNRN